MNYLMKNEKEADRLARQSQVSSFDVEQELEGIKIEPGCSVVEIGCGAGSLISFLNRVNDIKAYACDLQDEHVEYCKDNRDKSIHFFQHDILSQNLPHRYDYIFFRYVTHHLGVERFRKCINRLKMALKPDGKIIVIDCDGLMENIGTVNEDLIEYLEKIRVGFSGDTRMGRRIPSLLHDSGFKVEFNLQTVLYKDDERVREAHQWREILVFGKETYTEILGSDTDFARFKKLYFRELDNEHTPFFLNKVITVATL
jgi:cyclopropane fatty-acyl-phospholipid synthase-like methyltransferase